MNRKELCTSFFVWLVACVCLVICRYISGHLKLPSDFVLIIILALMQAIFYCIYLRGYKNTKTKKLIKKSWILFLGVSLPVLTVLFVLLLISNVREIVGISSLIFYVVYPMLTNFVAMKMASKDSEVTIVPPSEKDVVILNPEDYTIVDE